MKDTDRAIQINWEHWKSFREQQPGKSAYLLAPEMDILVLDRTSLERQFLFETLWRTGGKISEVLALRPDDFQLASGQEMVYFGGKASGRGVELVQESYIGLVERFIHQHEGGTGDLLLTVSRQTASNWLARRLEVLRGADSGAFPSITVSFNTFRNSFAFHALLNAVPLETLQRWLGHNQAQMTRRYMKLLGHDSRQQMQRMFS
ncbi:tyrosine-type recombinase/integrase [Maritalea sp.]|uniref:tyrosine-type recombinase/integrase n=1 Tax=Maritalea sp. TaxID=2003361 RepID=UPI003EF79DD5